MLIYICYFCYFCLLYTSRNYINVVLDFCVCYRAHALEEDFKYHETEFLSVFFLIRRIGETSPLAKIWLRYKRDNYVAYYQFWWTLWYLNEQSSLCHFINMIPFQRMSNSHLLPPFWENNPSFLKIIWKGRGCLVSLRNWLRMCMASEGTWLWPDFVAHFKLH